MRSSSASKDAAAPSRPCLTLPCEALLEEIAETLWRQKAVLGPELGTGLPGAALFLGSLSALPGFQGQRERAFRLLERAVARSASLEGPGLFSGITGPAWCLAHFRRHGWVDGEPDPCEELDALLLDLLQEPAWAGTFDLLDGLTGLGVYAWERREAPRGSALLDSILHHLARWAVPAGPGMAWPTPVNRLPRQHQARFPNGYCNLGILQGGTGPLALLAALREGAWPHPSVTTLLGPGMTWLESTLGDPSRGWMLANATRTDGATQDLGQARLEWNYGDLGASLLFIKTGRLLGNPGLEARGLEMAQLAAARALDPDRFRGASLNQGSAGCCLLFSRLHQATGLPSFHAAALASLDHARKTWRPRPDAGNQDPARAGLLDGTAGIGLALLSSALGGAQPWERLLLIPGF